MITSALLALREQHAVKSDTPFSVEDWLSLHGLAQYTAAFTDNHVDFEVLRKLTAAELRELGLASVGHRRKALDAIASLNDAGATQRESVRASPSVQRRQISVLFCDLVGSTQLSARVDPEDLRDYLYAFRAVVSQVIAEHQGWISQYLGDGVMAYFGYPQAHDHDSEHAVRAALGIIERCKTMPLFHGQSTQVRIGIATGLTVIGRPVGSEEETEGSAIGETPNLAARAQAMAEPNSVVIAPATYHLVRRLFDCIDLGAFELKGFSQAMHLWRVQSEHAKSSRFDAMRSGRQQTALIGRETQAQAIRTRLTQARSGHGHFMLIQADAGLGKSRLVDDTLSALEITPDKRLVFQFSSYNAASPLYAVRYFLERQAGITAADTPSDALDKLRCLMARESSPTEQELAVLAELIRLKAFNRTALEGLGSDTQRALVLKVMQRLLQTLGSEIGVVVLEDLHWIDPSSAELFSSLAAAIETAPLLLIATTRASTVPDWASKAKASVLHLEKLDDSQIQHLVEAIAAPLTLSASVQNAIVARSDGVPIFAEELTRGYIEASHRNQDASSQLSNIPSTLTESLLARLDSFTHGRDLAPIASVMGREFLVELLVRLVGGPPSAVYRGIEELTQAGIFVEGHSRFGKAVAFRHALVCEAAYSMLVKRERVRLHTALAHILEVDLPFIGAAMPHYMAVHLGAAGQTDKAIAEWRRAGFEAGKRSAYLDSVGHLQEALKLTLGQPANPERDAQEYAQRIDLISPMIAGYGHLAPSVGQEVERISQLSQAIGTQATAVAPLALQLLLCMTAGRLESAFALAKRIQAAAASGSETDRLIAHRYMSTTLLFGGHFASAVTEAERFLALYDPAQHSENMDKLGPSNHQVMVVVGLTQANTIFGNTEKAQYWGQKTLLDARSKGSAHTLSQALIFGHCFPAALSDSYTDLANRSAELTQVVTQHDLKTWKGHAALFAGLALIAQGHSEQGFAQARQGIDQLLEHRSYSNIWYILYAQACQRAGHIQEGLESLALAAPLIDTGLRWLEAEYLRLRGLLGHARGDALPAVVSDLKAAHALAQSQGAVLFVKRAELALRSIGVV